MKGERKRTKNLKQVEAIINIQKFIAQQGGNK